MFQTDNHGMETSDSETETTSIKKKNWVVSNNDAPPIAPTSSSEDVQQQTTPSMSKRTADQLLAHVLLFTAMAIFGGFMIIAPFSMDQMNPFVYSFYRNILLILSLVPFVYTVDRSFEFRPDQQSPYSFLPTVVYRRIPDSRQAFQLALTGSSVIVSQLTFAVGLHLTNPTLGGVLEPITSIFVCAISVYQGKERGSILKYLGVLTACLGAISIVLLSSLFPQAIEEIAYASGSGSMLVSPSESASASAASYSMSSSASLDASASSTSPFSSFPSGEDSVLMYVIGLILLIVNCLAYALYFVMLKIMTNQNIPAATITLWSFFFGFFWVILAALPYLPNFDPSKVDTLGWMGVVYGGTLFGSFAFGLSAKASSLTTPTVLGIYTTIEPLVIIAMVFIFLGEKPTQFVIIGATFIVLGVAMVIYEQSKDDSEPIGETKT